jgi:hypothetical protein
MVKQNERHDERERKKKVKKDGNLNSSHPKGDEKW